MPIKLSLQVAVDECKCTLDCGILYHKDLHINSRLVLYYIAVVLRVMLHDLPEIAKGKFELRLLIN